MIDFVRPDLRISLCMAVACVVMSFPLVAQITSSGYASVAEPRYVEDYPELAADNIYIFCNEKGNLSASFEEVQGNMTFEWSVYNSFLSGFDPPFSTIQGTNSQITDLESGGYRVRISNEEGLDTLFRAWIFVNSPSVSARVVRHDCSVLDLAGEIYTEAFIYYNPVTSERDTLPIETDAIWSAEPFIPTPNRPEIRIWTPPSVVTEYTFMVEYYLCTASYTITEDPVTTRAEFEMDNREGEAPLEVQFDASKSLNAKEFEWYFDYSPGIMDTEPPDDITPDPMNTYYIPGEYNVTLRTISGLCDDIFRHPEPVRVLPSELEVPNVFTPDGDAFNPGFLVRAVSMRDFKGVIYNRNGRKVFEWTDPGEGWDGEIDGSPASPGVYFYVITGVGWDDREYEFTGPLYLYRGR
jgi:gliding motility-associated-like protein